MPFAAAVVAASTVLLAPQHPTREEMIASLAQVIDRPTPVEREQGVQELLQKKVDLSLWLDVCKTFGAFDPLQPGVVHRTVELPVLGKVERTDIYLYVPERYDPTVPAPLLLWGHGAGGSGEFQHRSWQNVAEQLGMLVLCPTEPVAAGYSREPRERESALAALRYVRRIANVDENAVFVGGWSRGGHLAWELALRHPDLFAGVVPCVGGPLMEGAANNMRYLENVAQLPIRDLQGSGDDPRLLANLHLAFKKLKKLKAKDAQLIEFADRGHDADLSAVDWSQFFAKRREPWPKRVVRLAADRNETRAAWIRLDGLRRKIAVDAQPMVEARRWQRMNDDQRREYLLEQLGKSTARLEVTRKGKGRFVADGYGVTAFSLLLTAEQLGRDGKVEVRLGRKIVRKVGRPDAAVLLRDFAERFDRTRLPVVRVAVP